MNSSEVELIGRGRLIEEVLAAGLQVATPLFDKGIDLIVFREGPPFVARPVQLKAATVASFSISVKYEKFGDPLLLALVWGVGTPSSEIFVLPYLDAIRVAARMGYLETKSWKSGAYATTRPSARLRSLLEPWHSTPELWGRMV